MSEREIDLSGLKLESPVMVGAGPIKTIEQVKEIAESDSSAIIVGSITIESRSGNPGNTYFTNSDASFSINSKGLPNPGLKYYKENLPQMAQIAHDSGKPLIVSIAGFSPQEYAILSEEVMKSGADGQEINLGCPNVWKDGVQKRIVSFDEDLTGETLRKVEEAVGSEAWTAIKVSPYSDPVLLEAIARIINHSELINAVTTTNTFPNAFCFDDTNEPAITFGSGLGGLAGGFLKPIGMGQVKQFREVLYPSIAVIGVGGIEIGGDVNDYLSLGASAVQITTAYINFGPSIFTRIKRD